jgi:hypothetical protein
MISRKYPRNKLMMAAGLGYFVLFALFIISKNYLPDAGGGWSDPPIFDYLYLFGAGICFSILGIGYTYYSWTLNEEDFIEWYKDQQLFGRNWVGRWSNLYPKGFLIWSNRISSLIGALIGIAISSFMLFAIFKYFFR